MRIMSVEIFGIELVDVPALLELTLRLLLNLVTVVIVVRYIYFPVTRRKDYFFSYLITAVLVFLICFLLANVKLQIGFALGLFAIFGIIRYRTTTVPIKEMTYLFLVIGVSVINALANKKVSYAELFLTNLTIIFIALIAERFWLRKKEAFKNILYEKPDLIRPEKRQELYEDIKNRTGLPVIRIETGDVDYLRDSVELRVWYEDTEGFEMDKTD
ncbi:MAG TPA: DUF4956 domain-containing protein [Bacteroidales bacterium]|nr:DUF4956 domain-containing protein [Bacteroidales bacterium]HQK37466.1 DUF4956 domain-containing protein [Bacteroidales bacterium]